MPESVTVHRLEGKTSTLAEVLAETWTDAVVIVHDGRIVLESYGNGMTAQTPHLMMSVTKSVVGCVTGILADQGRLDPDEQVSTYVPEIAGSGYGGATVRICSTCAAGSRSARSTPILQAEVRVMERYMGWRPGTGTDELRGDVRLSRHAASRQHARRAVRVPLGGHRHAGLGVRTCRGHAGWPS